jgi:hypothetical protein
LGLIPRRLSGRNGREEDSRWTLSTAATGEDAEAHTLKMPSKPRAHRAPVIRKGTNLLAAIFMGLEVLF